jgi:hypothetical protein
MAKYPRNCCPACGHPVGASRYYWHAWIWARWNCKSCGALLRFDSDRRWLFAVFILLWKILFLGVMVFCIWSGFPLWTYFVWGIPWVSVVVFFYFRIDRVILAESLQSAPHGVMFKISIAALAFALFTSLGFLTYVLWQNSEWKQQVYALAAYEGGERASHDYQAGKLRLFVIVGERRDDKYSGTNDGPFEIWYPQYFPDSYPFRYPTEVMVSFYNEDMRLRHEQAEKLPASTNVVKP